MPVSLFKQRLLQLEQLEQKDKKEDTIKISEPIFQVPIESVPDTVSILEEVEVKDDVVVEESTNIIEEESTNIIEEVEKTDERNSNESVSGRASKTSSNKSGSRGKLVQ